MLDAVRMPRLTPIPQHIDRYRIVRRLAGRSDCQVFEALTHDGTSVALKLLTPANPFRPADDEALARFRREAALLQRFAHPGIVRVLDRGVARGRAWLALELLRGPTLSTAMRGMSMSATLACIAAMLDALGHLHAQGAVHRDLKPDNVMLDPERGPVLCDFGLVHVADSLLTQGGDLLGTPAYMAPECFHGEEVDARSDLFSFAVMAYELLTGQMPFRGATSGDIMLAVVQEQPPPASRCNPALPEALDRVLARGLAKRRQSRFASAAAFAAALREAMPTLESA